jgi:hypothetical protein
MIIPFPSFDLSSSSPVSYFHSFIHIHMILKSISLSFSAILLIFTMIDSSFSDLTLSQPLMKLITFLKSSSKSPFPYFRDSHSLNVDRFEAPDANER